MAEKERRTAIGKQIPPKGVAIDVAEGKALTRVHLDFGKDGISLATVGAASAAISKGKHQRLILKKAKDGISLAIVGAASAAAKK
jgi:hypothetical protein